jgi:gamma-glutamylcyclotransferase (GGCT)/AIG2-like uncharacterized protein YtfP
MNKTYKSGKKYKIVKINEMEAATNDTTKKVGNTDAEPKTLIFAYGTLMRGFGNNRLLEKARFITTAQTVEKYTMYVENTYGTIPYVSNAKETSHIKGEVWEVDAECLKNLDSLESHPIWYTRELIDCVDVRGTKYQAYLYFNRDADDPVNNRNYRVVESGDFRTVRSVRTVVNVK